MCPGFLRQLKLPKSLQRSLTGKKSECVRVLSFYLYCFSFDSMGSDQDGVPSKVSDSGVGGLESGEESWISDTEVSHKEDSISKSSTSEFA